MALTKVTYSMIDGGIFNAKDFGADADGDVTTELQAALDAAENGILLLTPNHTYAISNTLYPKQGCTIEGNGAIILNNISTVGNPFQIAESGITIQNLTIENTENNPVYTPSDPSFNGADIFINSIVSKVENITLKNITTINSIEHAAAIEGNGDCENIVLENITINGGKWRHCFAFEWNYRGGTAPENIITPKNILFINCKALNNNELSGYDWNQGWWISTCINVSFINCISDFCKNGMKLICGDVGSTPSKHRMSYSVDNCQFVNTVYTGIDTSSPSLLPPNDRYLISITNCFFSNYIKSEVEGVGYQIRTNLGTITISNCEFYFMNRAILMGSAGGSGSEDVKNINLLNNTFDEIYSTVITGHGIQDVNISGNQFYNICQGSTALGSDAAIYLDYQSDRNIIHGNQFGDGPYTPRFYIVLDAAGTPTIKIPTGNVISNNTFTRTTAGNFNISNVSSTYDYQCENIISNNISLAGSTQGMVSGAVYFSNEGNQKVAYDNAAPTIGTWAVGDTVWNTLPASGGTPGWKCTTAGTPGTWKAMANLA